MVPNLIGAAKKDLRQYLYINFQIEVEGEGDVVIHQLPKPGERLEKGSIIRIVLGDKINKAD